MKNIYNTSKKLGSLSFYNCHNIYRNEIINEDSILFTKSISDYNHLQNLSKLIENNSQKIKVIIVNEINDNIKQSDLISFINNNTIPLYKIEISIYEKIIDFIYFWLLD